MRKDTFDEFRSCLYGYDFSASLWEHSCDAASSMVALYLTYNDDYSIEYGDFHIGSIKDELESLLADDAYIGADETVSQTKLDNVCKWQVWLKLIKDEEPYANVHLFDYSDEGMQPCDERITLLPHD